MNIAHVEYACISLYRWCDFFYENSEICFKIYCYRLETYLIVESSFFI